MPTVAYTSPRIQTIPGVSTPNYKFYVPLQGATFREGSFLYLKTVGTITVPSPSGSVSTTAGPSLGTNPTPFQIVSSSSSITQGVVTVTATASGAPAVPYTYYCYVSYSGSSLESLPSIPFVINCPANLLPIITVSATGAPAATADWVLYAGVYYGAVSLQQAGRTTSALGVTYTFANPLTNNTGCTNAPSSTTTNIVGISVTDSASVYATGIGGSSAAGGYGQLLGAWANPPALGSSPEAQYGFVASLANNVPFEISLVQAWYPSLVGTAVGITLDSASGWHVADTTASTFATIIGKVTGAGAYASQDDVGGYGETGARVICQATSGVL